MTHAKSLRVIGQVLEAAQIADFEVQKNDPHYVCSASVTGAGESIFQAALRTGQAGSPAGGHSVAHRVYCFGPADILRLDAQAQKRRKHPFGLNTPAPKSLSQGLRTLGDLLDRMQVNTFHIVWTVDSVTVDYQRVGGHSHWRTFTAEEVQSLCAHQKLRRSGPHLFLKLDI